MTAAAMTNWQHSYVALARLLMQLINQFIYKRGEGGYSRVVLWESVKIFSIPMHVCIPETKLYSTTQIFPLYRRSFLDLYVNVLFILILLCPELVIVF